MLRGIVLFILIEVCFLGVGMLTFPSWMVENVSIWLPISVVLLMVFLCYENWPLFMQWKRIWIWADLGTAARIFRDEMDGHKLDGEGEFIDRLVTDVKSIDLSASVFVSYLIDGMNENHIVARGVPENGLKERAIPTPVHSAAFGTIGKEDDQAIFSNADERIYRNIFVKKSSIRSYVKWLRSR